MMRRRSWLSCSSSRLISSRLSSSSAKRGLSARFSMLLRRSSSSRSSRSQAGQTMPSLSPVKATVGEGATRASYSRGGMLLNVPTGDALR
jgi:hypothetical protein